ncbi:homoprotocatechuate degradation operon regulator HpaR [Pseudooceanicola nitratireducens]|uniref:homoprotocatechuate degradation operon regulator HpaR n=1 Tax=Pseudooceanicola nitratireducens TaxID=517719 RepID=UPI0033407B0A
MPDHADGFQFSSTHRSLPMALLRAREVLMDRFRPMLLAHGVTEQQWRVLRVLKESQGLEATELAKRASILAPSLSRIIKTLESRGFIEVRKSPTDGRRSQLTLSPQGTQFIDTIAPESARIYSEILDKLGQPQIDALLDQVDTLINALSEEQGQGSV